MDHGNGAGTTDSAPVGPAGDAGPMRPGGTKTPLRPYVNQSQSLKTPVSGSEELLSFFFFQGRVRGPEAPTRACRAPRRVGPAPGSAGKPGGPAGAGWGATPNLRRGVFFGRGCTVGKGVFSWCPVGKGVALPLDGRQLGVALLPGRQQQARLAATRRSRKARSGRGFPCSMCRSGGRTRPYGVSSRYAWCCTARCSCGCSSRCRGADPLPRP
jgi:hypothetical protein